MDEWGCPVVKAPSKPEQGHSIAEKPRAPKKPKEIPMARSGAQELPKTLAPPKKTDGDDWDCPILHKGPREPPAEPVTRAEKLQGCQKRPKPDASAAKKPKVCEASPDHWNCPVLEKVSRKPPAAESVAKSSKAKEPQICQTKAPPILLSKKKPKVPEVGPDDWSCPISGKETTKPRAEPVPKLNKAGREKTQAGCKKRRLNAFAKDAREEPKVQEVSPVALQAEIEEKTEEGRQVFMDLFGGCGRISEYMRSNEGMPAINLEILDGYDLTNPGIIQTIKTAIQEGRVGSFFCGPPCSTFSRSRRGKRRPGSKKGWPRALRSSTYPRGLPTEDFTAKETRVSSSI